MVDQTVVIGSGRNGRELKETICEYLNAKGYKVIDCDSDPEESEYYTSISQRIARACLNLDAKGIIVSGSGIGISIAANRLPEVRAVLCRDGGDVDHARRKCDANVLCLGAKRTYEQNALFMIDKFLTTNFHGGDHELHVKLMDRKKPELENWG